jgi:hypothetical protein
MRSIFPSTLFLALVNVFVVSMHRCYFQTNSLINACFEELVMLICTVEDGREGMKVRDTSSL